MDTALDLSNQEGACSFEEGAYVSNMQFVGLSHLASVLTLSLTCDQGASFRCICSPDK